VIITAGTADYCGGAAVYYGGAAFHYCTGMTFRYKGPVLEQAANGA